MSHPLVSDEWEELDLHQTPATVHRNKQQPKKMKSSARSADRQNVTPSPASSRPVAAALVAAEVEGTTGNGGAVRMVTPPAPSPAARLLAPASTSDTAPRSQMLRRQQQQKNKSVENAKKQSSRGATGRGVADSKRPREAPGLEEEETYDEAVERPLAVAALHTVSLQRQESPAQRLMSGVQDESPAPRVPATAANRTGKALPDLADAMLAGGTSAHHPTTGGASDIRTAARPTQRPAALAAVDTTPTTSNLLTAFATVDRVLQNQPPLLETPALTIDIGEPVTATQEVAAERAYPMPSPPPLFSLASVSQQRGGGPANQPNVGTTTTSTSYAVPDKAVWEQSMNDFFQFIDNRSLDVAPGEEAAK